MNTKKYAYDKIIGGYAIRMNPETKTDNDVAIPCSEDGYTNVIKVADKGFKNNRTIERVTIHEELNVIGEEAFLGCSSLKSIVIPKNLKTIGKDAFKGCVALESVFIDDMDSWYNIKFENEYSNPLCTGGKLLIGPKRLLKTDVIIPDWITEIPQYLFYGYKLLKGITIHENVESIGEKAFYDCAGLKKINFNAKNMKDLSPKSDIFCEAGKSEDGIVVQIGINVNKLPAHLFYSARRSPKIKKVIFLDGGICVSIGKFTFCGCHLLKEIELPSTIKTICMGAFRKCTGLINVFGLYGVDYIGEYAFCECTHLKSFTIPDGVTRLLRYTFYGCSSLEEIIRFPISLQYIDEFAFGECEKLIEISYEGSESDWKKVSICKKGNEKISDLNIIKISRPMIVINVAQ